MIERLHLRRERGSQRSMANCPAIYVSVAGARPFVGRMSERLLVCKGRSAMHNLCLCPRGASRADGGARLFGAPGAKQVNPMTIEFGNAHWEHAHEPCRAKVCGHRHWRLTRHRGARG